MTIDEKPHRIAAWLGLLTAGIGITVFAGRLDWNNSGLFSQLNGFLMEPAAALCLVLGGASLWLQLRSNVHLRRTGAGLAALAISVALAALARTWFGIDLGLDEL